jgi:hypothetical protein
MLGLMAWVGAQEPLSVRPDVTIVIRDDPATTAEYVEITVLDPQYPKVLLEQQIARMGTNLEIAPRGLTVFNYSISEGQSFLKAKFAINGLVDHEKGTLNLSDTIKPFMGAQNPFMIRALSITFDGAKPNANTIQTYSDEAAVVDGKIISNPPAVEYLVSLKSQDPNALKIPDAYKPPAKEKPKSEVKSSRPTNLIVGLIVLASVLAGLLVYFLALSRGGGSKSAR